MKCKIFYGSPGGVEKDMNSWMKEHQGDRFVKLVPLNYQGATGTHLSVLVLYREVVQVPKNLTEEQRSEIPHCPKCNRTMQIKANNRNGGLFYGCPGYPECNGVRKFMEKDWEMFGGDPGSSSGSEWPF